MSIFFTDFQKTAEDLNHSSLSLLIRKTQVINRSFGIVKKKVPTFYLRFLVIFLMKYVLNRFKLIVNFLEHIFNNKTNK